MKPDMKSGATEVKALTVSRAALIKRKDDIMVIPVSLLST